MRSFATYPSSIGSTLAVLLVALGLVACSQPSSGSGSTPGVNTVSIAGNDSLFVMVDSSLTLTAAVSVTGSVDTTVTWSSSNPNVLSIDGSTGVATGVAEGNATVTATSTADSGKSDTVSVTVVTPPNAEALGIAVDQAVGALVDGEVIDVTSTVGDDGSLTLSAGGVSANFNANGSSSTSSLSIASTRSADKRLQPNEAFALSGSGYAPNDPMNALLQGVTVTTELDLSMTDVDGEFASRPFLPQDTAPGRYTLVWTGRNEENALVSFGLRVDVVENRDGPAVLGVAVSPTTLDLDVGESSTIEAFVTSVNGGSEAVAWSSADETVASVSQEGVVTATGVGTAKVFATSTFDDQQVASTLVTVIDVPGAAPQDVSVEAGNGEIRVSFTPVDSSQANGAPITNYAYTLNNGTTWTPFNPAITTSPVIISGLVNGALYDVALRAVNAAGQGPASASVRASPSADSELARSVNCAEEFAALASGIETVSGGGALPSMLVVTGELACPILATESGGIFAASARHGNGRIVHTGHEGFLANGNLDAFLSNIVSWSGLENPRVGVDSGYSAMERGLTRIGVAYQTAGHADLGALDVWFVQSSLETNAEEQEAILAWVEAGGTLVTAGHAWYWASENDADAFTTALEHPGNKLLAPVGITITKSYVRVPDNTTIASALTLRHAATAVNAALSHLVGGTTLSPEDQAIAAETIDDALDNIPFSNEAWVSQLRGLIDATPSLVPTEANPINVETDPIRLVPLVVTSALATNLGPDDIFDVAAEFPGPVSASAARTTIQVTIDATYAGIDNGYIYSAYGENVWRSTGAYAPPGEPITVIVPEAWVDQNLKIQIGAHTANTSRLGTLERFPDVVRADVVTSASTTLASGFGGPVYITVPAGAAFGTGSVSIQGAVAMPRFVLSETDAPAFLAEAARADVPFAELESPGFILTVPTQDIDANLDPQALMQFWEGVQGHMATLAGYDTFPRPTRFAMDTQIALGYFSGGYPVMNMDNGPRVLDATTLATEGYWDAFHILGYNYIFSSQNVTGAIRCINKLYVLYVFEEFLGLDRSVVATMLTSENRQDTIDTYLAGGPDIATDFQEWACLEMFLQLEERYGWTPLITVHTELRGVESASRPTSDSDRINDFAKRYSLAVARDLTAFFEAWGFSITESVENDLVGYPDESYSLATGWGASP